MRQQHKPTWSTACPDWADRIRRGRPLVPALPLFENEAEKAVEILNLLRFPDVAGTPTYGDVGADWFRDIVRALFGAYDPTTGIRHISELFLLVPKKNSKTTNGAALMLIAMLRSRRPRAEFLLVAPTKEVAQLAYDQAVGMVEADSVLKKKCHIQDHIKRIGFRTTGASLKIKTFHPKVVTGSKPAGVLLDELHVIAEQHDADRVIGQLRGGLLSQPEGFLVTITTQSERAPAGVFKAELLKARAVRDGRLAAPILPVLYEFPPDVDWRDTANWPMVLPNLGRSITLARLEGEFNTASESSPEELRRWASQHLDIEIGVALLSNSWAGAEYWAAAGDASITLEWMLRECEVFDIGIDGGGLDDLLGLCVLGRQVGTGKWVAWCHAWAHPIVLARRKSEAPRLRDFAASGDLGLVERIGQDITDVADLVERVWSTGKLDKIGVDPVGIGGIVDAIEERGIAKESIVGISQGWRLTGAIKTTERRLAAAELVHSGSPMMAWCAGNARVEPKGNAVAITKQASGTAKIDPLMALFNAVSLMALNPQAFSGSVYDTIGAAQAAERAAAAKAAAAAQAVAP